MTFIEVNDGESPERHKQVLKVQIKLND